MSREIPEVVRAAAGLAATVLDEARRLPQTLPGLPVRVIGLAMQTAMKVQQQYAGLVARGDELLIGMRGANEPGMATFDDEEPATGRGFHDSAFDRAATLTRDDELSGLSEEQGSDDVVAVVAELSQEIDAADRTIEEAAGAPTTGELVDELVVDERVESAAFTEDPRALQEALEQSEGDTSAAATPAVDIPDSVDVLTPDGDVATVEGSVTDEGIAAPEAPEAEETDAGRAPVTEAEGAATSETPATDALTTETSAPREAPVAGYDDLSIAQLRGRLRGYTAETVQELLDYEQSVGDRQPYLRMLRNRLERLQAGDA